MSWQQLRANHRVRTHSPSRRELEGCVRSSSGTSKTRGCLASPPTANLPQPIMLSSNLPKWPLHVPGIRSLEQLCIKRTLLSKGDEVGLGYPGGAHLGHVHRIATS